MGRRLVAEALGTALLLAAVVGSGIMAERLSSESQAIALLCNTAATGAALVVLITIFAPLSGAHFNPAVTLYFALRRDIARRDAALYVTVQIAAAVAGVWLAHAMFGLPVAEISRKLRDGPSQWLSEFVATAGLLLTIAGCGRKPDTTPALVGLYIAAAYWFTASTSFANPAVTLARSLTDSFAGIAPSSVPGFVVAQLLAAVVAGPFTAYLFQGGAARAESGRRAPVAD
ncbi:MAG TPA: MIP/aquaporin family protein [Rhizomicrobium sp.]|nr:MIP/aquaporin family protein [Rhizomicrobium sp.]